jgi:hypothetical protein
MASSVSSQRSPANPRACSVTNLRPDEPISPWTKVRARVDKQGYQPLWLQCDCLAEFSHHDAKDPIRSRSFVIVSRWS